MTISRPRLILASASPRRAELLHQLGLDFEVFPQNVPERRASHESPEDYVCRVAREKALRGLEQYGRQQDLRVLGADTEVVLDDVVLGKPQGENEALEMLARLSGRVHTVLSAVVMAADGRCRCRLSRNDVRFREISAAEAHAYWATGEPSGKAGAYAIQGLGAVFVAELRGSYSAVMGLPLYETAELLAEFGVPVLRRP